MYDDQNDSFVPVITEITINDNFDKLALNPDSIPVLPLRNLVLFPTVPMPVSVGRAKSLRLIKQAYKKKQLIGVVTQRNEDIEEPEYKDLYEVGVIAEVLRIFEMPDKTTTVIVQGKKRFRLKTLDQSEPFFAGQYEILEDELPEEKDNEFEVLASTVKELTIRLIKIKEDAPRESLHAVNSISDPMHLMNFICSNMPSPADEKQTLLEEPNIKMRLFGMIRMLTKEVEMQEMRAYIQAKAREDMNQQQKEYFLQQQIKTIQEELGGNINEQDVEELRLKAKKKKWSKEVDEIFDKEVRKLERINPQSPDYSVQINYLQVILGLPWNEYSKDKIDLAKAQKILDKDHFGLEKVKERILEHLAVLQLKGDMKSPIICLYGPPGVGKTSLGKSIADSLNRKYVRVSLGGLHDEAEIRGHRRTYIGAMPGRIIQGLQKAGTSNPVFILDEIDKLGDSYKGDPASALLEVLDPEQNNTFHDNYLDIDFDLSKVMFIATANNIASISRPLLDRMEMIDVSGYILEEKVEIAHRHLGPKQMEAHGLKKGRVKISKKALEVIIENYTRESGVRELDKKIAKIMRRLAIKEVNEPSSTTYQVTPKEIEDMLGVAEYSRDKYQNNRYAGVVTGLAWTAVGGEILFVESSLSKGKGGKLTLTGNLGDVMKESAMLAMEYIKAHAHLFELTEEVFDNWNVHVHVPEGAIPKDGPSAGVTMITSLVSSFTQRQVKPHLAMTGEITLRGKVLPVGGIKEKILAAKRAGIKEIILCEDNKKNILEIPEHYLTGLTFHYVNDVQEVIKLALLNNKVENAIEIK